MDSSKRPSDKMLFERILRLPRRRAVVAAVCYRQAAKDIEFLLVRTRAGRWTFPKGGVERGESRPAAAAREAQEEAGAVGWVDREPFAAYRCAKSFGGWTQPITVQAFLCEVTETGVPDEAFRDPSWFSAAEAKDRLGEGRPAQLAAALEHVIDCAISALRWSKTGS
jgi:8-oxo-dGTP pyrophosphatase MutT (NUDIX family)